MSDQFGNTVDKDVWVPARARDWLGTTGVGIDVGKGRFDYVFATPAATVEYALAFADGMLDGEGVHTDEGEARGRLTAIRKELKFYRIPEEYWPVLMQREVSITRSAWQKIV